MTDYMDYRKWTEQEDESEREYLQEYGEYSPQDIYDLCNLLIQKAECKGLEGCYLRFQSHVETYDCIPDSPSIVAVGYRPLNQKEKEQIEFEDKVEQIADIKGIALYQAREYLQLVRDGVITERTTESD